MIKHLYDCFSNWNSMGQVFFYSDPHLNDEDLKEEGAMSLLYGCLVGLCQIIIAVSLIKILGIGM